MALKGRLFPKLNRTYSLKLFLKERNSYSKQHRTEVVAHELDVNLSEYILNILYGFGLPLVEKMHFFEDSVTKKNKIRAHELLSSLRNVSNIGDVKKLLS